jgi:hypothetical protein
VPDNGFSVFLVFSQEYPLSGYICKPPIMMPMIMVILLMDMGLSSPLDEIFSER